MEGLEITGDNFYELLGCDERSTVSVDLLIHL